MLSRFDWLTPPITLYYNGILEHTSIASVIMSLIGYLSSVVIGLYLSIDFFKRKNPTVFYFNRYVEDSGIYPLNSEMVFSNFQIDDTSGHPFAFDSTYLRVIGTEQSIQQYAADDDTTLHDHWIYDLCDNGTDIKGIEYLYDYTTFNQSYCIKKYYKKDEDKYYKVGDANFRWPHTDHGTSHPNKTFYGLIFENCKDDRVLEEISGGSGKRCKSVEEIKEYVKGNYVRFYMIDHYPDVYNYKEPFSKYFYNIDTTLSAESYTVNHINFNPAKIVTNNGYFFDNTITEQAYMFDQNAQENGEIKTYNGAYLAFYFWLKNSMFIYDRTYKRVQDVLAEIEAMIDVVIFIATIINNFISEYITLNDTAHVLFSLQSKKVNQSQINRVLQTRKRTIFENAPPRRNNMPYNYYNGSSKNNEENSERVGMESNHQRLGNSRPSRRGEQVAYQRVPNRPSNNQLVQNQSRQGNSGVTYVRGNSQMTRDRKTADESIDVYKNKNAVVAKNEKVSNLENGEDDNVIPGFDPFKETKLSLSEFTLNYLFFCRKKENTIESYENFRMKIISEENLIQNYLDIHSLNKAIQEGGGKAISGINH